MMSASLIYAKVYPVPAVVTVAAEIAPELIVTEATPPLPSPRIGIAEIVEPEDVLKLDPPATTSIVSNAPSTAADDTVESVETWIKSVDIKFKVSADVKEYIYLYLYPSDVVKIEFDVDVGSTVAAVLPLLSITL